MSGMNNSLGLSLELRRELGLRDRALSGDLCFSQPAPLVLAASAEPVGGSFNRALELRTGAGAVHNWFNADLNASLATGGVSASVPASVSFRNGVAGITLTLATAAIASGSHATVSVWGTVLGQNLATALIAFTWASND
jgi:hypothetical protein